MKIAPEKDMLLVESQAKFLGDPLRLKGKKHFSDEQTRILII